jgi:zinc transporter
VNDFSAGEAWDGPSSAVICSFGFDADGALARTERLRSTTHAEAWSWTHVKLGDVRWLALLRSIPDLPAEALELFAAGEDRIQLVEADGWLFGVLPDLERNLSGQPQGAGRLVFACDGGRLMTGRLHPLLAVDDLRRAAQAGETFATPTAAVVAHVQFYIDRIEQVVDELAQQLASIEDYVLTEPQSPRDTGLSALRRRVARQRRELQALRSTLARALVRGRSGPRVQALADDLAELIAAVDDADRDTGVLQERGRLLHEEIDTLINSATNRSMRALTIISTLLIPPTLVTGAFGMNLKGIPFGDSEGGFAAVAAICAIVVGGALLALRRMGM